MNYFYDNWLVILVYIGKFEELDILVCNVGVLICCCEICDVVILLCLGLVYGFGGMLLCEVIVWVQFYDVVILFDVVFLKWLWNVVDWFGIFVV